MRKPWGIKPVIVVTLISLLLSLAGPAYAREKTSGDFKVVDRREYPIIFIPGMAGSTLDVGGASSTNAWPGSLSTNDEAFKVLALKDDGRTPVDGTRVVATGTIRYGLGDVYMILGDWQSKPIYQGFYDYMDKEGYKLDQNPNGKVFFDFPYDFRQDNHRWTTLLDQKIDAVIKQTKADKVILVGHSMGGLQARLYMESGSRAGKVAAVVFMGTPHHGSVMPFWAMTEGYNFANGKLTDKRMWEISGNWEAGYQLLPDFDFIKDKDGNMHGIDWINTDDWISSQEYDHYLAARKDGKDYKIHYGLPNHDFARKSVQFHQELGNTVQKYPGVKYFMIEGTGQETTQYLTATFENVGLPKPVLRLVKSPPGPGDGTVPAQGAVISGVEATFRVASDHGAIPSNTEAQKDLTVIRKAINNEDVRTELVTKLTTFAKTNIPKARTTTPSVSSGEGSVTSLAKEVMRWMLVGMPDPEKIKLSNEIKDMALQALKFGRANITITQGVDKNAPDKPDHLYINIVNYEVVDAGTGVISNATASIRVDSLTTMQQALVSTDNLAAAYSSGKITVEGTGWANKLNGKVMKWVSKYFNKRR